MKKYPGKKLRYGLALPLAALVTLGVFFGMQGLIATGETALTEDTGGAVVDFVRVREQEQVREKDRKPERPPEPQKPPPEPDMPQQRLADVNPADGLKIGAVNIDPAVNLDAGIDAGASSGEYLPIVKVAPIYPQRAMQRGLEGWVLVEFTVTPAGSVRDVHVIDARPQGVFDEAARDAALKFKYKPRMVDGKAVAVDGVRNLIRFELQK